VRNPEAMPDQTGGVATHARWSGGEPAGNGPAHYSLIHDELELYKNNPEQDRYVYEIREN
jgi:hypothetical protein